MSTFRNAAELSAFQDDVLRHLCASYMLASGEVIQGQSLSHLTACLRDSCNGRRWRIGGGYWGITSALDEAGFTRTRGRTMRYTRNGVLKPYAECDVVTL